QTSVRALAGVAASSLGTRIAGLCAHGALLFSWWKRMVTGPSGQPSAGSRTAYGSSQIFAAVVAAPLAGGVFFAWPAARAAINRHNHIFFLNFINVPLIDGRSHCVVQVPPGEAHSVGVRCRRFARRLRFFLTRGGAFSPVF